MNRPLLRVATFVVVCAVMPLAFAQETALPGLPPLPVYCLDGLTGLQSVGIVVEDLNVEGARQADLSKADLETVIRAALLRSRLPAFDDKAAAYLHLNVALLALSDRRNVVWNVGLELTQEEVTLSRKNAGKTIVVLAASTWRKGCTGISPGQETADRIKNKIRDFMDEFAIDYSRENPPPAPSGG